MLIILIYVMERFVI